MQETSKSRPLEVTELLTLMSEVSDRVNSTLDLDELLARIAEIVKRAIDYDAFAILLFNEKTQELRVFFSQGHDPTRVKGLRIKSGEGIVGRVAATRRSVLVNDVTKDSSYIPSIGSVRSELAVPLTPRGRLLGVIDVESAESDFFNDSHVSLLELLASRMGLAIENAQLYRRSLRQARTLQTLNEISRELSSVLVLDELLRKVGTLTKRLVSYHRLGIFLADNRSRTFNAVISLKQDEHMPEKTTVNFGQGLVGAAAMLGRPVVAGDVSKDARYIPVNPETRSELTVPLIYRERVIGVIDMESPQLNYFNDEHVRLLSTLAPQIAIAIENARLYERVAKSEARLERDLRSAQEIQMHLMPGIAPKIPGLNVALHFQPARELGGDLYEFLSYGRDRQVIVIGDVSGKGAPAALYGAMASGTLRSLAPLKLPPADMMKRLNGMFMERSIEGHFITLAYALWEPRTRVVTLTNAGMPLPILVRHDQCRAIHAEGVPLGLLENTEYEPMTLTLEKGDLLAFFSDGITEANNTRLEEFSSRRLENVLRENSRKPPQEIVDRVFAEVRAYEAGEPQRDDQTLIVLSVR